MFRQSGEPTTNDEALDRCRACAVAGTYVMAEAAETRLKIEGLSPADIRHVLETAAQCTVSEVSVQGIQGAKTTWTVVGASVDGADITLTIAFDHDVAIVL